MATIIKATFMRGPDTEKEGTFGTIRVVIKVIGSLIKCMAMASTLLRKGQSPRAGLRMISLLADLKGLMFYDI